LGGIEHWPPLPQSPEPLHIFSLSAFVIVGHVLGANGMQYKTCGRPGAEAAM
jgi:hypothetical protein